MVLLPTLREVEGGVVILDQTRLPEAIETLELRTLDQVAEAIRSMQVRGAPLIGVTAAFGVAIALASHADDASLAQAISRLAATRPTAVNLQWALSRMQHLLAPLPLHARADAAWREARTMADEDEAANAAIGRHGLELIGALSQGKPIINVMTHCNAGRLATMAHGTALAPVYAAHHAGMPVHVWVSETRPRNQGLLTAWELADAGVPHTLIADNAAGLLLMQGRVDMVIVGADRIAANGDTANKVGTYLKALAARQQGVPFYVAAPRSTIDLACAAGTDIPIEERDPAELGAGHTPAHNPAFDITPAGLITGIITESGIVPPGQLKS